MWLASCNYSNPCSMSSKSINPSVEAARNESALGLYVSPLMVLPKSKSEAISSSCFGYKNKTTWKSISFWQVDIVHKLILFKLTPNNFLFKSKTKYTVMFGILITSVFTWHFVYVTVLFFSVIFFYGGYNGRNDPQPLTRGEWQSGKTLRWRREEEVVPLPVWRTDADVVNLHSPVCVKQGFSEDDTNMSSCPLLLGMAWGGRGSVYFVLFWCRVWWFGWSGTTESSCGWRLTGWGHKRLAVATKRHKLKRAG